MSREAPIAVTYFQRRQGKGFSLETVFRVVRENLPTDEFATSVRTCPFESRGVMRRLLNTAHASIFDNADVCHIEGDVLYLAVGLRGLRTVITIPDVTVLMRLRGVRRLAVESFWYRIPESRSAAVTTLSSAARRDLCSVLGWPESRVCVIPVAISPAFLPTPPRAVGRLVRVLQVGTAPNKNVHRLARALDHLPVHLTIIGRVDLNLRAVLDSHLMSWRSLEGLSEAEMVREYAACDFVTFVSTSEGFGMPILEAQAVERPVITSRYSSMPEVAGPGALLVDPFSEGEIRAGIEALIRSSELRSELVACGRANRRRFRASEVAEQYAELYRGIANREK